MFDIKIFHTNPDFSDFFEFDYEIFVSFIISIFCLIYRLNAEKQLEIVKRKEKTESHLYMVVRILYEDSFYGHQGIFLLMYGRRNQGTHGPT